MSVWLTIPSARPAAEIQSTIDEWRRMGYRVALWRDPGAAVPAGCELLIQEPYQGYAVAVNALTKAVMEVDPDCDWMVTGGDDTTPDMNHTASEIARQCTEHFGGTWGICQPTGDRYAGGSIDRIAGSPWMGREWCETMYGGVGPLFPGYDHMHVDEECKAVAEMLGVYWPRPDLTHYHNHFMRASSAIDSPAVSRPVPPHLVRWNTREHWNQSQTLFRGRRSAGFPGHQPLTPAARSAKQLV